MAWASSWVAKSAQSRSPVGTSSGGVGGGADGGTLGCARHTFHTPENRPKRKAFYGRTKAEALAKRNKALADYHAGLLIFDANKETVGQYLERWLNESKRGNLAPRTYATYQSHIRGHLVPALGHVKLTSLTSAQIQALYRAKRDAGLSPATIHSIHAPLTGALKQAVRWKLLAYNVAEAVELPKLVRHEGKTFSVDEAKRFLEAARGERLEALYVLAITCGLRQGELLGLGWDDVDLEMGTMWVRRQLQRMRDGSGLAFLPLKNPDGRREVALGLMALEALRKHRVWQAEEKLMLGPLYEDMGLVFATGKGTPLEASNVVNRSFKPLLSRAGVSKIKFHELRHTCGTIMGRTGVEPKYAQDRLGHADISVTLNTYTHVLPEARAEVARKIEEALL
jgi:integrase